MRKSLSRTHFIVFAVVCELAISALVGCGTASNQSGAAQGETANARPSASKPAVTPNTAGSQPYRTSESAPTAKMPDRKIGTGGNDFYLFTQLRGAIASDPELSGADVVVNVNNGSVTLTGTVNAAQKAKVEKIARSINGVKSITNQLGVSEKK